MNILWTMDIDLDVKPFCVKCHTCEDRMVCAASRAAGRLSVIASISIVHRHRPTVIRLVRGWGQ